MDKARRLPMPTNCNVQIRRTSLKAEGIILRRKR
jgi:hypothetical protein